VSTEVVSFAGRVLEVVTDRLAADHRARRVDAVAFAAIVLAAVEATLDLQDLDEQLRDLGQDLGGVEESDVVVSDPGPLAGAPERSDVVPSDRGPDPFESIEDDREAPS